MYSVNHLWKIWSYLRVYSVSYLKEIDGCVQRVYNLSVAWGWLTLSTVGGWSLSVMCGMLAVVCMGCELCYSLETCWWFSAEFALSQLFVVGWRLSAWVTWTVSFPLCIYAVVCRVCTLSDTWGRLADFCMGCVNSVSYLRQDSCFLHGVCTLAINYGALAVVSSRVCNLTVTWGRL